MTFKRLALAATAAAVLATVAPAYAAPAADPFEKQVAAAKAAMMADPQAALTASLKALEEARARSADPRLPERVATAQWLKGEALLRLNRLDEAEPVIRAGLAAVAGAPNTKLHGDLLMALGGVQATKGQVLPALQGFQTAFRVFGKASQPRSQAMALQNIGSIYQDAGDYAKVLQYYEQSAELYPDDPILQVTARNNIGNAYRAQKKFAEAVAEFQRAREIARGLQSPMIEGNILTNQAAAEVAWGRLDAAQRHLDEALRLNRLDPGGQEWLPQVWGVAAQVQLERGHPQAAATLLGRTFQGADLKTTTLPFRDFHETAYRAYDRLGDHERALTHLEAFKRLDDAARELTASTNAALTAAQFDFANQQSRIARLKAGQLQRDVALARTRDAITRVLLAGSILVGVLLLVGIFSIRRSRNEVRAANGKLSTANRALEKALAARTEFLATTSHEIRTPLNGILGMTQVILADRKLDPALRDRIALVHGSGETMRALVDDILDVAKIETGKVVINRAEMDLGGLCQEAARLWTPRADEKGLSLSVEAAEAPERIVEDAGRLRQILFNLMSNAVKFTQAGEVRLTMRAEASAGRETLVLTVSDTGIGIPADSLGSVFESFSQVDGSITRTYGGAGLGLSICRALVQAMGGEISVASVVGQGSTFTVRLPLQRVANAAPEAAATAPLGLQDCRLLLCDGNPLSQAVLRAVLQPQARSVETVGAWQEAASAAEGGLYDLVLVDGGALGVETPARLEAVRALVRSAGATPVAVMVPETIGDEAALAASGVAQVIRKPIAAAALVEALGSGIAHRAVGAATLGRGNSAA